MNNITVVSHSFKDAPEFGEWEGEVKLSNKMTVRFHISIRYGITIEDKSYRKVIIEKYLKPLQQKLVINFLRFNVTASEDGEKIRKNILIAMALFDYEFKASYNITEYSKSTITCGHGPLKNEKYCCDLALDSSYDWQLAALKAIADLGITYRLSYDEITIGHITRRIVSIPNHNDVLEVIFEYVMHMLDNHEKFKF